MSNIWALMPSLLTAACALILLGASVNDIAARTIPNGLPATIAALGTVTRFLQGEFASGLIVGVLVLAAAWFCWRRNWIGGGDVKLLSAAAIALPPVSVAVFIAAVAIAGGILALTYLVAQMFVPVSTTPRPSGLVARTLRVERWRIGRRGPLPYACAIAAGFLFVIL